MKADEVGVDLHADAGEIGNENGAVFLELRRRMRDPTR
jgi:hypothetical protein